MRYLLFCIVMLISLTSSAQFTGAIWAGARVSGEAAPPIPYEPETEQYIDTLIANSIDTAGVWAVNWLIWTLKGNNPSYAYNYWDSLLVLYPIHGATALSHSLNLKNLAAGRVTWYGSPAHTSNGVIGTGTTAYGALPYANSVSPYMEGLGLGVWAGESDQSGSGAGDSIANMGYFISGGRQNGYIGMQSRGKYSVSGSSGEVTVATGDRFYPFGESSSNLCIYMQKDDRQASDSTRFWYNTQDEYRSYMDNVSVTYTGQRYYTLMGRSNSFVPDVSALNLSANCFTYFFINRGYLTRQQGHGLVAIFEEYNQKLRGL